MSNAIEPKKALPAMAVEPVTRNDLIELVLLDLEGDLEARACEARQIRDAHLQDRPAARDYARSFPDDLNVEVERKDYGPNRGKFAVTMAFVVPMDKLPAKVREWELARIEHDKAVELAEEAMRKFQANRGKVKTEFIRRALQGTAEGREVLEAVQEFRGSVAKRFAKGRS